MNESGYCGCGMPTNKAFCDDCSGVNDQYDEDGWEIRICATEGCGSESYSEELCPSCKLEDETIPL